ncbi:MAG: hypothetical protein A2Z34_08885 [Planctomycetes bacterium RBG_16_59_8]|nr:MAG: hypothetical protein A2Z34_08885 [Planctomycetes bacterium RBG_16_59_8]
MRGSSYESIFHYESSLHPPGRSAVSIIILTSIAIFALQTICESILQVNLIRILGLVPLDAVNGGMVWQFISYQFLHADILHIFLNLFMLYMFGREVELVLGWRKFLALYLACGAYAGLCYCWYQFFLGGETIPCVGASGALFGVMMLYALYWPNRTILFFFVIPMRAWTMILILIGIELYYTMTTFESRIANVAHLGGATTAWLIHVLEPRLETFLDQSERRNARKRYLQEFEIKRRVDTILEKISREGMPSLTKEERRFLQDASRKLSDENRHETR